MNAVLSLLMLAALTAPQAGVESLPEIARRIRAEGGPTEPVGPVFTNENIRQAGAMLAGGDRSPSVVVEPGESAQASPESAAPAGELNEQEWRSRFEEARAVVARARDRAMLTEQELQTLNRRLLTESGLYNREGQLGPQIVEKEAELETARRNLQSATEALDELRQELRRAGGPPGWAR